MLKVHEDIRRLPRWLIAASALCVLLCVPLGAALVYRASDGAVADLPDSERQALYLRTLETLRRSCSYARESALTEYCREQAEFIQNFPECDPECRELAKKFRPLPSR